MIHFEKSQPAPTCLAVESKKSAGNYKCGDVLSRLQADFHSKCYICEMRNPTSINVEHFVPHEGDKHLKFSWDNLFWSCAHCNNTKLAKFKNLLNCTVAEDSVESRLHLKFKPFPFERVEVEATDSDPRTLQTQQLLDEAYNGTTKLKMMESANIRTALLLDIRDFQDLLFFYFDFKPHGNKTDLLNRIKGHLSRGSSFAGVKRWIIRDNAKLFEALGEFLDD
ncbi:MAG: hypothetical protein O3A00_05610 [Planctomycetota bacterium]|nr:hypothetical protein [Planctomycetota bacterium]